MTSHQSSETPTASAVPIIVDGTDITKPHNVWVGKCFPPPAKKSAIFWRAFHIAEDERNTSNKVYAVCNLCGHVLISHNSGTTNLRRHVKSQHENVYDKLIQLNEINKQTEGGDSSIPVVKKRGTDRTSLTLSHKRQNRNQKLAPNERALLAQAMYCISSNRPFEDLEQPALKTFVDACLDIACSGDTFVLSAHAAKSKAMEATQHAKELLKIKLKSVNELVASLDVWETRSNQNSVYLSLHWIDGFDLNHCVLSSKNVTGSIDQETLVDGFLEDLRYWEIEDKVNFLVKNFAVTETEMRSRCNVEAIHCVDDLLQQVIDAALNISVVNTTPMDDSEGSVGTATAISFHSVITKAQNFVNLFLESKQVCSQLVEKATAAATTTTALHELQGTSGTKAARGVLIADIVGRWWSTLAMATSLLSNKDLLDEMVQDEDLAKTSCFEKYYLNPEEWEKLEALQTVLKPCSAAIKMLGENRNCTSSLVPFIQYVVHNELKLSVEQGGGDSKSTTMAKEMLKHFEAKFGENVTFMTSPLTQRGRKEKTVPGLHKAALIAHALDPRFKQLKVMSNEEDKNRLWDVVLSEMMAQKPKLCKDVKEEGSGENEAASILRGVLQREEVKREEAGDSLFHQYAGVLMETTSPSDEMIQAECEKELQLYRAESTSGMRTTNGKEDPLSWWRIHQVAFPTLWSLAKMYLAIPATAAGPDLAFNMETSATALHRYNLEENVPQDYNFLYENSWLLDELASG